MVDSNAIFSSKGSFGCQGPKEAREPGPIDHSGRPTATQLHSQVHQIPELDGGLQIDLPCQRNLFNTNVCSGINTLFR